MAQSNIHGKVADKDNKPLDNANVLLLNAKDSSLIKGVITSGEGTFSFLNKLAGQLIVSVTFTGYDKAYTAPFIANGNSDIDLGKLTLVRSTTQLQEIAVNIKKPMIERKIDRMVINVKNSITSTGSTALEVLERSPGVFVDRQNNSLSLEGKNGVVVMINGKINHMPMAALVQMLAGMNSANIEKIELITTPPANFDAEGNAGFINIVLISNTAYGTNGSYSGTLGYGQGENTMAGLNFNHRGGKINISGDLSFSRIHMTQLFEFYRQVHYNGNIIENNAVNNRDPIQRNYNGRVGFDFQANKKTLLGAEISSYDNKWSMFASNGNTINLNNMPDTVVNTTDTEINEWSKYGGSFNVQHTINEKEKIYFEYEYDHYHDNNPNNYFNSYFDSSGKFVYNQRIDSKKNTPITINVISFDYSNKISKRVNLDFGIKFSYYRFTNDVVVSRYLQNQWATDKDFTSKYFLKEDISAAYTSLNIAPDDKNNIKLGLRYEHTASNLGNTEVKNIVDRHYGKLFPGFFIMHKINEHSSLNFSYTKRITRPTFKDLAPFVYFIDPNTFISGNSALQPATTNTLNLSYSYKRYILSLSYSDEENFIAGFQSRVDAPTNKQYLSAENYPSLKTAGLSFSLPFMLVKWWNMQTNINVQWQQVNARYNSVIPIKIEHANFDISSTHTFTLPRQYSFEFMANYISPRLSGTYITKPTGALNLGIQKKLKQKGKISFNIKDLFNTSLYSFSVDLPEQNLVTWGYVKFTHRTLSLTYTKTFGSNEIKANRKRSTVAEEERKRVE